jgi:hypothetical protein
MLASLAAWLGLAVLLVPLVLGLRYRTAKTLLALASIAVTLAAAEVTLRYTYPPSWQPLRKLPSREYHHINRPNAALYEGRVEGKDVIVRTNEDGFRTAHRREEFLEYRDRIAVMGDSFTFGADIRQEFVFTVILERVLRERLGRGDIAVLNAGTISYSPLLGKRVYDGILARYRPTLVLYVLDVTDIGDDYNYERELVGTGADSYFDWRGLRTARYYGALGELVDMEWILDLLGRPLPPLLRAVGIRSAPEREYDWYDFRALIGGRIEKNRYFIYRHPLEQTRPYFDRTWRYISALADSVRRSGARFELVVAPRYHHWNPKESPKNWEDEEYELNEPYQYEYFRYFDERRAGAAFEILDLLPAFRATAEFPLVFEDDPHWNEAGHAFVARTLASHLIERGWVGGAPAR